MKQRIAFFGNCQLPEMHRILSAHAPFLDRFEPVLPTPVYAMTQDELEKFAANVNDFDILVCQFTMPKYAPADNASIKQIFRGRMIELPSIYFDGHLIDLTHHVDTNGNAVGPTGHSSVVLASAFTAGFDRDAARFAYLSRRTVPAKYIKDNYAAGIKELRRREKRCQIIVSDYIERQGPSARLFHTWNHPNIDLMLHVVDQLTDMLGIERVPREQYDAMAELRWPVLGAVSRTLGVEDAGFTFMGEPTSIEEFIDKQYLFYEEHPDILEINKAALNPAWLRLPNRTELAARRVISRALPTRC